jgi:hypothetical protein
MENLIPLAHDIHCFPSPRAYHCSFFAQHLITRELLLSWRTHSLGKSCLSCSSLWYLFLSGCSSWCQSFLWFVVIELECAFKFHYLSDLSRYTGSSLLCLEYLVLKLLYRFIFQHLIIFVIKIDIDPLECIEVLRKLDRSNEFLNRCRFLFLNECLLWEEWKCWGLWGMNWHHWVPVT